MKRYPIHFHRDDGGVPNQGVRMKVFDTMQRRLLDWFVSCWSSLLLRFVRGLWSLCPHLAFLHNLIERRWRWPRRIVSRTSIPSVRKVLKGIGRDLTLAPSHTSLECSAYCSTIGRMLVVTIRCAREKLLSISGRMSVCCDHSRGFVAYPAEST